jgi:signal transduction histidine kinase
VVGVQVRSGALASADGCVTVGRVATLLTAGSEADLPDALDLLVADLGLRSAVLREASGTGRGDVLAVAGGVMHAVPLSRGPGGRRPQAAAVELPVHAGDRVIATLTVVGGRPSQLPALRACAAVLALRLDSRPSPAPEVFAAADAEVNALADALHDGPVQDLVVARYAADAAAAAADPARSRDAVQGALVAVRRALWLLRPRGAADGGLSGALCALSDQLARWGTTPLLLELDADADAGLSPAQAAAAYRLVQAVATGAEPVTVTLRRTPDGGCALTVVGGQPLPSAAWTARAHALGARLTSTPGRQELAFSSRLELAP